MGFWSSKKNSRSSTNPGGGQSDPQSSVAPSQPAGFKISRLWKPTGKQEENGNKSTLQNLVTNPPTESPQQDPPAKPVIQSSGIRSPGIQSPGIQSPGIQSPGIQSPGIQSPGIQLPVVNVKTPASQSHSVASLQSVNSTPAPPQPPSIWERTLDIAETILHDHGLPPLDRNTFKSASSAENIQAVLDTLKTAQGEDQKGGLTGKDRVRRILRGVEKYTKIADTAVQHSPEVTALVWAGIKGILQVCILLLQV